MKTAHRQSGTILCFLLSTQVVYCRFGKLSTLVGQAPRDGSGRSGQKNPGSASIILTGSKFLDQSTVVGRSARVIRGNLSCEPAGGCPDYASTAGVYDPACTSTGNVYPTTPIFTKFCSGIRNRHRALALTRQPDGVVDRDRVMMRS